MYLKCKVITDSRKERVEKVADDTWSIWVKVPAVNNAANQRVLEIIRESFPHMPVRIVSGHHSPSKIVSIG